jgi:DNA-binding transcriptional regulator GbsR (MarR family)
LERHFSDKKDKAIVLSRAHPTALASQISKITKNTKQTGYTHVQQTLSHRTSVNTLPPLTQQFVSHFGEMGSRWGINRTVGQIYALIFVSAKPLNADDIADALEFSRSNVSIGLKELQGWRLVKLKHLPGDRREYFEAPQDVWEIFKSLAEERRRREIEPTLSMLRAALLETPVAGADLHAQSRMQQMHELIELSSTWFDDVQRLSPETLARLMRMGAGVKTVLDMTDKLKIVGRKKATP